MFVLNTFYPAFLYLSAYFSDGVGWLDVGSADWIRGYMEGLMHGCIINGVRETIASWVVPCIRES